MLEEIYVEPPKRLGGKIDKLDMALRLVKSVYGLKEAPNIVFDKLSAGLVKRDL